jgi:hypothetical protein
MMTGLLMLHRQVDEREIDIVSRDELSDLAELGVAVDSHELPDEGLAVLVEER